MARQTLRAPSRAAMLNEGLSFLEAASWAVLWPRLALQPRGDGRSVLVLPGFGAGDSSTAPLRAYLDWLGYRSRGWGLGSNSGEVPELIPRVADLVDEVSRVEGEKVPVLGWSLGGYLAREAARERPHAVSQVITLGSPIKGGPKYTALAQVYRRRGLDLDEIERQVAERDEVPLAVPVTAIYSRFDGVVGWQACVDDHGDERRGAIENIEVATTHLGLGISPRVLVLIAQRLARVAPAG